VGKNDLSKTVVEFGPQKTTGIITEAIQGQTNGSEPPRFKAGHSLAWYASQPIDKEQTLLANRYLCRSCGMFVVAPSGMGEVNVVTANGDLVVLRLGGVWHQAQ
jgi:hypothetical protein